MLKRKKEFKNILVVRTDRIGDVVLTTPAIESLRKMFPKAHIALLVSPHTREIVENNPFLDDVIVDDFKNQGFFGFWKLVSILKKKNFDLAINYHLKKRTNFLLFHAKIPYRIGFQNKKFGFLLTDQIPDPRTDGSLHESEYCLRLLEYLGSQSGFAGLHISIKSDCEIWAENVLKAQGFLEKEKIFVLHPGASCPSKRWPFDRFALVITHLQEKYKGRCILIGSSDNQEAAKKICQNTKMPVLDLTGKTTVGQMISVLKRSHMLISNDSGPAHVAAGLGIPVVSIFGRNQKGLSVTRWKPLGLKSKAIHKDAGCLECRAHECQKAFECLKLITVSDVLESVQEALSGS